MEMSIAVKESRMVSVPNRRTSLSATSKISYARRRRMYRLQKLSRALMLTTAVVFICAVFFQVCSLIELSACKKNIQAVITEREMLTARIDNLQREINLETRYEVIRQRAQNELGMVEPAQEMQYKLNIISPDETQIWYANAR